MTATNSEPGGMLLLPHLTHDLKRDLTRAVHRGDAAPAHAAAECRGAMA